MKAIVLVISATVLLSSEARTQTFTFYPSNGVITAPFQLKDGAIVQERANGLSQGGRVCFEFQTTNSATYGIVGFVNAPDTNSNWLYISIDAEPAGQESRWDVPVTKGFENRIVNGAAGGGSAPNSQRCFQIGAGVHRLIVQGGAGGIHLKSLQLRMLLSPPQNLRVVATQ